MIEFLLYYFTFGLFITSWLVVFERKKYGVFYSVSLIDYLIGIVLWPYSFIKVVINTIRGD